MSTPNSGICNDGDAIHRLPNELLAEIFLIGWQKNRERVWYLSTICLVCRIWRDVALSASLLWTKILYREIKDKDATQPYHDLPRRTEERIEAYLSRSKNATIDIGLILQHGRDLVRVKDMIFPHLSRCRSIHLVSASENKDLASQLFPLPRHLPQLTYLHCSGYHDEKAEPIPLLLVSGTGNMARLRRVSLCNLSVNLADLNSINTENVNQLVLKGCNFAWRDAFTFASQCHSLCKLELVTRPPTQRDIFPPITLPQLTDLEVFGIELTAAFRAPNLQTLSVHRNLYGKPYWPVPSSPTAHFPNLHTLTFFKANVAQREFIAFLQCNPTIKELCISDYQGELWELGQLLLDHAGVTTGNKPKFTLLPSLKRLAIYAKLEQEIDLEGLRSLRPMLCIRGKGIGLSWAHCSFL